MEDRSHGKPVLITLKIPLGDFKNSKVIQGHFSLSPLEKKLEWHLKLFQVTQNN